MLHFFSVGAGIVALVFVIFAWSAGADGTFLAKGQTQWFIDAGVFFAITIWLALGTLIHQNIEKK